MKRFNSELKRLRLLSTGIFGINKQTSKEIGNVIDDIFFYAGYKSEDKHKLFVRFYILLTLILTITILFFKFYVPFVAVLVYVFIEYSLVNKKIIKRCQNFEEDYPAFLISLASCIKSGKDPLQALELVKDLFLDSSILKQKLLEVLSNIQEGMSEEEAINNFARDIKHPDIDLFRVAFILSRKEGSGLYKPLRRLTKVTRQRPGFRRKAKAAVAMQKVSAFGILGSVIFIALVQMAMNREQLFQAIASPIGVRLMLLGVVFVAVGIIWMLYMTREKI